jgi:hypothetical protein
MSATPAASFPLVLGATADGEFRIALRCEFTAGSHTALATCSSGQGTCMAGYAAMAGLAGVAEVGATAAAATATGTAAAGGVGAATYAAYGLLSAGAYVAVPVAGAAYLYYRVLG